MSARKNVIWLGLTTLAALIAMYGYVYLWESTSNQLLDRFLAVVEVQSATPTPSPPEPPTVTPSPTLAHLTSTPTSKAVSICMDWETISDLNIGNEETVCGLVRATDSDATAFYIYFGLNPGDFYLVHYGDKIEAITAGECIMVRGNIEQLGPGGSPLMIVNKETILDCPEEIQVTDP